LVDFIGSYVAVSIRLGERSWRGLKGLGLTSLSFCGESSKRKLRREVELITRRLSELSNVLDAINIERLVGHVGEDREP
jgi:hypothetical protein